MTNKEIQNIYFQNNEVNALYMGVDLIWKKENGGGEWTGKYMVEGYTVEPNTTVNSSYYNFTSDENGYFGFDLEKIPTNLTTLYVNFDVSKKNNDKFGYMFYYCDNLTNVIGTFEGLYTGLDLHYSPLTAQSAMVFINGLAEVEETKTLRLSATTYDALTPEQIAIATSKGWTVSRG